MILTDKKANYGQQLVAIAAQCLKLAQDADNLTALYFAEGFNSGPNAIVDADFNSGPNTQLNGAKIVACITALQAIQSALPSGVRDNLRKMLTSGLP